MPKYPKKVRKKNKEAYILLTNLAQVLDACDKNKLNIKLKHGVVCSKYGYVLPFKRKWVVRMLLENPFFDDDEDDDLSLGVMWPQP